MLLKLTLSLFLTQGFFYSQALAAEKKIVIAVLDDGASHEEKIVKALKELLKNCRSCQIETYPIYKKNGDLTTSSFLDALKAAKKAQIINLSWNIPATLQTGEIEMGLAEAAKKQIIVAAAGAPSGNQITRPLSETVIGKIPHILVVGELSKKGHLSMNSYYSEDILTALTPVGENKGSSFSVVKLTAAIAKALSSGVFTKQEAVNLLRQKKQQSFKQYPSLKELGL
jgi:hypothetical protein